MNEALFEVIIEKGNTEIISINQEAKEFEKRWNENFPKYSILIYILNSPNELEKTSNNKLSYIVDLDFEEEIITELKRVLND